MCLAKPGVSTFLKLSKKWPERNLANCHSADIATCVKPKSGSASGSRTLFCCVDPLGQEVFLQARSYSVAGPSRLEGILYKAYSSSLEVSGCLRYCDSPPLFLLFCSCCLCINLSIHDLSHPGASLLVLPTNSPFPWLLSSLLPWGTS